MGVVGDRDDLDHRVQVAVVVQAGGLALEGDLALGLIAGAADVVSAATGDDEACGHLVLRERAGLVGADHGDGTECLDRGELAGDGVAMGHALHAERERDGEDGGQAFGDGRDREADRGEEEVCEREVVQAEADPEHEHRERDDDHRQDLAELPHLPRERGLQGLHLGDHAVDAAELGIGAGGDDHAGAAPGGDQRAGVGHAEAVADAGVRGDRVGVLVRWHRLAGQRRLLDAQVDGLDQAQVGRYAVARAQAHDVARHQVVGLDLGPLTVAPGMGMHREHLADAGERLLGLALLDEADDGVDDHHAEDDAGVDPVAEGGGDRRGAEQHVDEHVVEVLEEALQQPVPGRLGQAVGADLGEAARGLVRGQARRAAVQRRQDLVGRAGVGVFEEGERGGSRAHVRAPGRCGCAARRMARARGRKEEGWCKPAARMLRRIKTDHAGRRSSKKDPA